LGQHRSHKKSERRKTLRCVPALIHPEHDFPFRRFMLRSFRPEGRGSKVVGPPNLGRLQSD
jgi:hypothetical protein